MTTNKIFHVIKQKKNQNLQFNSPFRLIFLIIIHQPIKNTAIIPKTGKINIYSPSDKKNLFLFSVNQLHAYQGCFLQGGKGDHVSLNWMRK